MKGIVGIHGDRPLIDLGGGTTRRILTWNEDLMGVEVAFETGSVGSVHDGSQRFYTVHERIVVFYHQRVAVAVEVASVWGSAAV